MKKSYDYFKTLNNMSERILDAYGIIHMPDRYKKDIIIFHGIKRELSEKLSSEFVAPIERNDIYNLSAHLVREVSSLDKLSVLYSVDTRNILSQDIDDALSVQGSFFLRLSEKKAYGRLLSDILSTHTLTGRIKRDLLDKTKQILNIGTNILWKYTVVDCALKFIESIDDTFGELERVVINNS